MNTTPIRTAHHIVTEQSLILPAAKPFSPAQLESLLNCIETTADINGVYSPAQLENKIIIKTLLAGSNTWAS